MERRDISQLIKMHKLYVDEQRRVLADKQRDVDVLMMEIAALQANLEIEKEKAAENGQGESHFTLGAFIENSLRKNEKLQRALSQKERVVEVERDKLSQMFEELKRYEIAQENWNVAYETFERKAEESAYDERAGQQHQRKTKE